MQKYHPPRQRRRHSTEQIRTARERYIARRRRLFNQIWFLPIGLHALIDGSGWALWAIIDGERVALPPDPKDVIVESFWTPKRLNHMNKSNGNCTCHTCHYWKARGKYRIERQRLERAWRVMWNTEDL